MKLIFELKAYSGSVITYEQKGRDKSVVNIDLLNVNSKYRFVSENRFNDGDLLGGVALRMQSFFDQSFAKEAAAPANANNNINNNHHMNQPGSGMNI